MFACLYGNSPRLAELASSFSPLVERVNDQAVVFSIAGLHRLIGDAHQIASEISRRGSGMGCLANLAIASNPSTAILAARNIAGVTIIPVGDESATLAPLPLEALPATPELSLTLHRWGIRTVGDLAALPEIGLADRLGEEGVSLYRLARGEGDRFVNVLPPPPEYSMKQELEDPVELLEPLLFIISAQLHELTRLLLRDGMSARRIAIIFQLESRGQLESCEFHRVLDLPFPMRAAAALLKQAQLSLEAHPPPSAVFSVQVMLDPAEPRIEQRGLFLPAAPEPEKLHTLLLRLKALAGEDRVGSPQILNTHRPDAWRIRPCAFEAASAKDGPGPALQLAIRYFRPPVAARIVLQNGRLRRILSERVCGDIVLAAGPWRTSGDWWADTSWCRDEWDVVLENQAVYRIYRSSALWFLDGSYD